MGRIGGGIVGEGQSNSCLCSFHYWRSLRCISKVYGVVAVLCIINI